MTLRPSRSARRPAALALLLLAGCDLFSPDLPAGARRFAPPPVYARWWAMTERCAGLTGDLDAVHWYVVPGVREVTLSDGRRAAGFYRLQDHRVVLAGDWQLDGPAVRHEMLHALERVASHRRARFLDGCGGIVQCDGGCLAEAGPPPAPDAAAPRVRESALLVWTELLPAAPAGAVDDGHFSLGVVVLNPAAHTVVVEPANPAAGPPRFEYLLSDGVRGVQGGLATLDAGRLHFAAGEAKRAVFDFRVGERLLDVLTLVGAIDVEGRFGALATPPRTVLLNP